MTPKPSNDLDFAHFGKYHQFVHFPIYFEKVCFSSQFWFSSWNWELRNFEASHRFQLSASVTGAAIGWAVSVTPLFHFHQCCHEEFDILGENSQFCFLTFYNKISSSYQMNYMRMATLAKHSKAPKFPMLLSQIINFFKIVGRTDKTQSAPLALCHCHRPRSAILASNLFDLIWGKKIRHKVIKRAKLKVWLDDLESYELPLQSRGNHPSSTFILGESIFVIK